MRCDRGCVAGGHEVAKHAAAVAMRVGWGGWGGGRGWERSRMRRRVCTITEAQVFQVTINHTPERDGMIEGKLLPK